MDETPSPLGEDLDGSASDPSPPGAAGLFAARPVWNVIAAFLGRHAGSALSLAFLPERTEAFHRHPRLYYQTFIWQAVLFSSPTVTGLMTEHQPFFTENPLIL